MINALVHRDYSFSGSIIINVNDNEIKFISIGGLLPGLLLDDIKSGISQPRNKKLVEIFHRLHLIESYGTGIRKIYNLYANFAVHPRIEVTSNTFKIILPNMNSKTVVRHQSEPTVITTQMSKIIEYIKENGHITDTEVQSLLGVKKTRAYMLIQQMIKERLVVANGRGADKIYIQTM